MREIDKQILQYCGIYQMPQITKEQKEEVLKRKRKLEKLTGIKIERIYAYGKTYWGENASENTWIDKLCFLADERTKYIYEFNDKIKEHKEKEKYKFAFASLCQFEKRAQSTAELEYYIAHYGALIYDMKKESEIDEKIYATKYAYLSKTYKQIRNYIGLKTDEDGGLMFSIIQIYLLKIGYYIQEENKDLERLIEYANYVSEDEKVEEILIRYVNEKDINKRTEICYEFERYINKIKQVRPNFKNKMEPTMKIYERKKKQFEKEGVLDLTTLTKEELYIMYVIERRHTFEIAQLYGVDTNTIRQKRNNWKMKLREIIITDEELMYSKNEEFDKSIVYISQKRMGRLEFEKCVYPILKFMEDDEKYLLKEFWKFTEYEKVPEEIMYLGKRATNWYRATYAVCFLKDNELIEEIDYKKYKITQKGKYILTELERLEKNILNLETLVSIQGQANLLGVCYNEEDITKIKAGLAMFMPKEELEKETEEQCKQRIQKFVEVVTGVNIPQKISGDCIVEEYKSIRKRKKTIKNFKKKTTQQIKYELSDVTKSNLGIKGEQYLYQCLVLKKEELLSKLGIKEYSSIIFYNENYDKIKEDKSVGHGCDIEVILKNKKHLYLEVKTRLDNIAYYTMTYQEYQCNLENQDNYFVIKINNLKYLNIKESKVKITVIQNPYRKFMDNPEMMRNISFYTQY